MDFETQLAGFLIGAQAKVDAYFAEHYPSQAMKLVLERQSRYIRVVAKSVDNGQMEESGSAWAFIEIATGTILKCAGWKAPAKGARGTIMQEDFGVEYIDRFGPAYLPKGRKAGK